MPTRQFSPPFLFLIHEQQQHCPNYPSYFFRQSLLFSFGRPPPLCLDTALQNGLKSLTENGRVGEVVSVTRP